MNVRQVKSVRTDNQERKRWLIEFYNQNWYKEWQNGQFWVWTWKSPIQPYGFEENVNTSIKHFESSKSDHGRDQNRIFEVSIIYDFPKYGRFTFSAFQKSEHIIFRLEKIYIPKSKDPWDFIVLWHRIWKSHFIRRRIWSEKFIFLTRQLREVQNWSL